MLSLAALLAFDPFSRGLRLGAIIYAALGVCFSVYFIYLQVNFIHAFCIYCLISAVATLLLLILAVWRAANVPSAELIAAEFRRQSVSGTVTLI